MWYNTNISEDFAASIFRVNSVRLGSGCTYKKGSMRGGKILSGPTGSG